MMEAFFGPSLLTHLLPRAVGLGAAWLTACVSLAFLVRGSAAMTFNLLMLFRGVKGHLSRAPPHPCSMTLDPTPKVGGSGVGDMLSIPTSSTFCNLCWLYVTHGNFVSWVPSLLLPGYGEVHLQPSALAPGYIQCPTFLNTHI